MIPEALQKLILAEKADSFTLTLGGAGLSSVPIPEGHYWFVWSVQIFPMIDISAAMSTMADMSARTCHWYEFDDLKSRKQGFLHRTAYSYAAQGIAFPPIGEVFHPVAGADIMPVFWNFKGQFLTMRIWHMPQPYPLILDVPPTSEQQSSGPYDAATPILSKWQTGAVGQNWEPDGRRDQTLQNRSPRPFSIVANEIFPPTNGAMIGTGWPLVNLQVVSFPSSYAKEIYQ